MILTVIIIIAIIGGIIAIYFFKNKNRSEIIIPEPIIDNVQWKYTDTIDIPCQGKVLNNVELKITGNPLIKFEAKVNGIVNNNIKFKPSEGVGITKTSISIDENLSDKSRIIELIVKKDGE